MSELQSALLLIGLLMVLAVYGYNWLQQSKYRRKFGTAFGRKYEDALYRTGADKPVAEKRLAEDVELSLPIDPLDHHPLPSDASRTAATDGICSLIGADTDYIAVLNFDVPAGADSLSLLWKKRFDFGKNVYVCGLNSTSGAWERVIQESHLFYAAFKLSLQLVDRSGPVNEMRLDDFRDVASDIAAHMDGEAELPDTAAASARAEELDAFCAEVDQMIGINIMPSGGHPLSGGEVLRVAEQHGLALQADGAFHLADDHGHTIFTLGNFEDTPFQHHTITQMWVNGLTLLLDVPRVELPVRRFDEMVALAQQLADELRATVVDDRRVALGEAGIIRIRGQIAELENRMVAGKVEPGSVQARRLFS